MNTSLTMLAWAPIEFFSSSSAAGHWLTMLLDVSLKGVVILAVAGAVTPAMRKSSATARHWVWLLALVSLLALPLASAALPSWQVLPDWAKIDVRESAAPAADIVDAPVDAPIDPPNIALPDQLDPTYSTVPMTSEPATGGAGHLPPITAAAGEQERPAQPAQIAEKSPRTWIVPAVMAVWLSGALFCLLPLALGCLSLWRLKRAARPVKDGPLAELLARIFHTTW